MVLSCHLTHNSVSFCACLGMHCGDWSPANMSLVCPDKLSSASRPPEEARSRQGSGGRVSLDLAQDHGRPVTRVLLGGPGARMVKHLRSILLRKESKKGRRGLDLRAKRRQHLTLA